MNLKLCKQNYKYNKENSLNYNIFGEYIKKYKNKQVFIGGFGHSSSANIQSINKTKEVMMNSNEHKYQISLIIKRFNTILNKRKGNQDKKFLSFTSMRSKSRAKVNEKEADSNCNGRSNLMITHLVNVDQNNSLESNKRINELRTSKEMYLNKNKSHGECMGMRSSLNSFLNKNSNIKEDISNSNHRNKVNQLPNIIKAKTTSCKYKNRIKYDQGPFLNKDEEDRYLDPNYISHHLKRRYNFFIKKESTFDNIKWRIFKFKGNLSTPLLPKYSIRHIQIMNRKKENE